MISIILPTYNERENIQEIVPRICNRLEDKFEIIIVDDGSPDKTWKVAKSLSEDYPVRVIIREHDRGLATAVLRGFEAAGGDVYVVMDADLQHPSKRIPDLISSIDQGTDVAVASRMTSGGSFGKISYLGRVDTYIANSLAKILFPELRGIRDLQSGFFAVTPDIIDCSILHPRGFKILIEILVMSDWQTCDEIGYVFRERHRGESNLNIGTVFEYLNHIVRLRIRKCFQL